MAKLEGYRVPCGFCQTSDCHYCPGVITIDPRKKSTWTCVCYEGSPQEHDKAKAEFGPEPVGRIKRRSKQ